MEWGDQITPEEGFSVNAVTARHFSGRGLQGNKSQWTSFILTTMNKKIFIGGDSGYGSHFAEIGKQFGPFDLAILEDGQYNKEIYPHDAGRNSAGCHRSQRKKVIAGTLGKIFLIPSRLG